jgi:hypothetical protein
MAAVTLAAVAAEEEEGLSRERAAREDSRLPEGELPERVWEQALEREGREGERGGERGREEG